MNDRIVIDPKICHGKPVILRVDARQMHADGFTFYLTPNNVWLVDNDPAKYLSRDDESAK